MQELLQLTKIAVGKGTGVKSMPKQGVVGTYCTGGREGCIKVARWGGNGLVVYEVRVG